MPFAAFDSRLLFSISSFISFPLLYEHNIFNTMSLLFAAKNQIICKFAPPLLRGTDELVSLPLTIKKYKTKIMPVVLYRCEAWSLILREESRLGLFENRILMRIFVPKRDANGEWRMLHSLYRSSNIVWVIRSRRLRLTDHVARI